MTGLLRHPIYTLREQLFTEFCGPVPIGLCRGLLFLSGLLRFVTVYMWQFLESLSMKGVRESSCVSFK